MKELNDFEKLDEVYSLLVQKFGLAIRESNRYSPACTSAEVASIEAVIVLLKNRPDLINPDYLKELLKEALKLKEDKESAKSSEL